MTLHLIGVQPNMFGELTRQTPAAVLGHRVEAGFQAVELGLVPRHDIPSPLAARGPRACGPYTTLSEGETVENWLRFRDQTKAHGRG